ncbi:MAG: 2-oxoacid:acceptor oxidoreductase family protein [Myxococcales bacterium]|nr:2-oxoacid:acceptor oxidoreductase family protein [Myxococcales bacterium]
MKLFRKQTQPIKYPGRPVAMDGNTAVIRCERESTDAAGAYPITPSTQMGEMWAEAAAAGHLNISGRPLIFIEPEGEHAAAGVTAGLSMTGLRAANFSSGQGVAYMHESLYAAVGKRLTYVLNVGSRAMTKANLNVHAGHDDYHCIDDTGFFQLFAKNAQHAADLNVIAHRIAELALTPGVVAQDGFLTTHLIESLMLPERELIAEYLGRPDDVIDTPTEAQRIIYGDRRRRIPLLWDVDDPMMSGLVQNQDAYMQSVAAQRPFFFEHVDALAARAFEEYHALTGRRYDRTMSYRADDAHWLIVGQGSVIPSAEAVADYLRSQRKLKVGVVDVTMFRPFPADQLARLLAGRRGVVVLERVDQPLAVDLPLMREIRATMSKCVENGRERGYVPHPSLPVLAAGDVPALYSGCYGLGSRDLQPEGLIAAVENMIPGGARRSFFYLSIDFVHDSPLSPKSLLHQQHITRAYPRVAELALRGSENPNLMPPGSITVRFHSVGGWGAVTTGKNLAMTLYGLLGWHIKANPKYGSEKKGQPTTYYLSAAPEPIRVNCEYYYVDVVLAPDPNVFDHTDALAGLRRGGVFVLQSDARSVEDVWASIPARYRKRIVDDEIRLFALDGFKIAREEATDAELELRMQGIAFQGAFFACSDVLRREGMDERRLLEAIRGQIQRKFGSKGARVIEDNMRAIRRGFDEVRAVPHGPVRDEDRARAGALPVPVMVQRQPGGRRPAADVHRFWAQTGSLYARGAGSRQIADPFIGLGVMPAASALFRDMTAIRFRHPQWVPDRCTACGKCYTVCPDTAIPGLVSEVRGVLDTVLARVKARGPVHHLPAALRRMEPRLRQLLGEVTPPASTVGLFDEAIHDTLRRTEGLDDAARRELEAELQRFREELGDFAFAVTRPYFTVPESGAAGSGGLLSITVDPTTCKGCMECIAVCEDDALRSVPQTEASIEALRRRWQLWLDLPNTPARYQRITDLEAGAGALETLLLDKNNYLALTSGDGACLGCSEKTVLHLFVATVEALMQERVRRHLDRVADLVARLEAHVKQRLTDTLSIGDPAAVASVLEGLDGRELTLEAVAHRLSGERRPVDPAWLARVSRVLEQLRELQERYRPASNVRPRASMGMVNATGCSSVWGSTYPFNPYPFPWTNHLFQDAPSVALGVFEGHMAKMAEGLGAVRRAELELRDEYQPRVHDEVFARFSWEQFTDEEWLLCPPVVAVGGDGAMYDIGFQNLSRLMASGKPSKVVVLDTQVYSNTGGQACTSGFLGQISDMAQFGQAAPGKKEVRKEIGLIAMAHRTTYVMQSSIAHPGHMIEGFIAGLRARRPAVFNCYTACQPEHGIADDAGARQARLAVESRAYPLFRYDPARGDTTAECLDLEGNPQLDDDWPRYTLTYREFERDKTLEIPLTFADFALTEARFRKHFRSVPPDAWSDQLVPLAEYLSWSAEARADKVPFVWVVDREHALGRLRVDDTMVASCEDRRQFWTMLRALAGHQAQPQAESPGPDAIRREVVARIVAGLMKLADGPDGAQDAVLALTAEPSAAPTEAVPASGPASGGDSIAPWIDSDHCSSCDECIRINPKMFAYDDKKHAYIANEGAGTYLQLVKAAERCTAGVIHPGLPRDRSAKDIDVLIARARRFNGV